MLKPKLSIEDLVEKHLAIEKGIKFNIMNAEEAKEKLKKSSYYYKLGSYRKNFIKRKNDDTYINLEFAYLVDLSIIDMELRYVLLKFCLDIEHSLKTILLFDITEDSNEDGYKIVTDFLASQNMSIEDCIGFLSKSVYSNDMYEKNKDHPSIWFIIETLSFGNLSRFVEFYYKRTKNNYYGLPSEIIRYVKNIRNRAAHNYPIIYDVVDISQLDGEKRSKHVTTYVSNIKTISKKSASKRLGNAKIHDLTAIFILYRYCVNSEAMLKHRHSDIMEVMNRCKRNKDYYKSHASLQQVYFFISDIVDNWLPN